MKTHRRTSSSATEPRSKKGTGGGNTEPRTPNSCGPERVPAQWAWHHRTLLHLRDRIQQAHAEHASQAVTPPDSESNDAADSSQDRSDRDVLWAELGAENDKLFEIDCALQRIRDGVYGICEATGLPIPSDRLRAVPWTRYCRAAAEVYETRSDANFRAQFSNQCVAENGGEE
jgi:RNA polymerase-binding transcription factor DksA